MWLFKDGKSVYVKDCEINVDSLAKNCERYFEENKTIITNVVAGNSTVEVENERIPTWEELLNYLGLSKRIVDGWETRDGYIECWEFMMQVKDYICGKQIGSYVNNKGNASGLKFSAINNFGYRDKSVVENTGSVELVIKMADK